MLLPLAIWQNKASIIEADSTRFRAILREDPE